MHRLLVAVVLAVLIQFTPSAFAKTKVVLGVSLSGELATAFVAQQQGFFAKHGLDVDFRPVAVNPNMPAALLSKSVDIGNIATPILLQAADNGVDLVVIGNVSQSSKAATRVGLLARKGVELRQPRDLEGKKVGIPSVNGLFHVLLRHWMAANGVDGRTVQGIEVVFPNQADVLKSGNVDAVISIDPFLGRIVDAGLAQPTFDLLEGVPEDVPTQLYTGMREWVANNRSTVEAFRRAIADAAAFIELHPDETRAAIGKHLRMPPEILAKIPLPKVDTVVTVGQIEWWADVLRRQGALRPTFATASLVAP